jgi:hypothetical protein
LLRIAVEVDVLVGVVSILVHHHGARTSARVQNVSVGVRVLSREEPSLGLTFPFINHSLVWTWALTLGEVHVVSETSTLTWLSINLLLIGQSLFKLYLLLNFLLFIGQNWVFALSRLK